MSAAADRSKALTVECQAPVDVGAGMAGGKTAEALRAQGFDGRIVLLGTEPHRPYERPPLSKGYLLGSADRDSVFVHPSDWYSDKLANK